MTKDSLTSWSEVMADAKGEYKKIFSKIPFPKTKNFSLTLVKIGLMILTFIVIVEFFKYPNLDYPKLQLYILMIISSKLSWLIIGD